MSCELAPPLPIRPEPKQHRPRYACVGDDAEAVDVDMVAGEDISGA
jgi:hypothetical protein